MSSDEVDFSSAMAEAREELVRAVGGLAELQHAGLDSDVFATRTEGFVVKFFRVRGLGVTRGGVLDPTARTADRDGFCGMMPREALSVTLRTIKAHKALGPRGVAPLLWKGVDETKMVKAAAVVMARHEQLSERPDANWLVRKAIEALLEARKSGHVHGDLHWGQVLHNREGDGKSVVLVDWDAAAPTSCAAGVHPHLKPPIYGPYYCLRADDDWAVGCLALCALCPPGDRWAFVRPDTPATSATMMEAWRRVLGEPPFNAVRLVHKLKVTRDTGFRQVSLDEFVSNVSALHGGAIAPLDDSTRFAWTAAWSLLRWTNCASLASLLQ
jgi:hypothetical protein